ncbi:glycosyltransferase [Pelagerythrobacter sp.]|uniref:glycosyltransferase n=1 Tax=Pelagerythrobacter sp. TaxID=2800702 RepID=UPI0035B2C649
MTVPIALAIPELDAGGPDRVMYELLTGLDRNRFAPVLITSTRGGRYFDALPRDVRIIAIDGGRYPARAFAREIDRIAPALVFTTLRMNVTALAARIIQRRKQPVIIRQANAISADFAILNRTSLIKHRLAQLVIRLLMRRADAVVAQSDDMARELRSELRPGQEIAVIGNPVSLDEIQQALTRQQAASPLAERRRPAVVTVGRLAPQKGFDLFLPAFAAFRARYPQATLTIFGEGPERAALERQAEALGLADCVSMPGRSEAVLAEIARADLFVSSSRYEGFSNAMLEAMALGVPVVATDCPGATRDLVVDGETGFLAATIDSEAIGATMERAMASDPAAVGRRGRDHVARNFEKSAIVRKYEDLFLRFARR